MKKKFGSFLAIIIASITVCSTVVATPVSAFTLGDGTQLQTGDYEKVTTKSNMCGEGRGRSDIGRIYYGEDIEAEAREATEEDVMDHVWTIDEYMSEGVAKSNCELLGLDFDALVQKGFISKEAAQSVDDYDTLAVQGVDEDHNWRILKKPSPLLVVYPKMTAGWSRNSQGQWFYSLYGRKFARDSWELIGGKWYRFAFNGVMYANTTTPDGYRVDANGAWIK